MNFEKILRDERRTMTYEIDAYRTSKDYAETFAEDSPIREDAETILAQGGPLAPTVVLIPVAAHQEAANIHRALSQYARQETTQPFSIVLNMNAPSEDFDKASYEATLQEIERSKRAYPHLDVRYIQVVYFQPTIGEIRGNLWDATLVAGVEGGTISEESDMIGINHDIDVVRIPRNYIADVQDSMRESHQRLLKVAASLDPDRPLKSVVTSPKATPMKHAYDPAHPHASKAAFVSDYIHRISDVSYEAGIVVPMSWYAGSGGFDSEDKMSEMLNLLARGKAESPRMIRTLPIETDVRRFVERLPNHGLNDMWGEDTFHSTENYRTAGDAQPDISEARLHEVAEEYIEKKLQSATALYGHLKSEEKSRQRPIAPTQQSDISSLQEYFITAREYILQENDRIRYETRAKRTVEFILDRIVKLPNAEKIVHEAIIKDDAVFSDQ